MLVEMIHPWGASPKICHSCSSFSSTDDCTVSPPSPDAFCHLLFSIFQPINGEQLKLLESKSAVEVALAEHDRVRSAIEEVDRELRAKAIAETRNTSPASAVSPTSSDSQTDAMFTLASSDEADNESRSVDAPKELPEQANAEPANVTAQEGPAKQPNIDSTGVVAEKGTPSKPPRMESVGVATDPCPTEHSSVQTDLSGPPPPPGLDPSKVANELATAALIAAQDKEKAVQ